jgi:hypothetical protein
MTGITPSRRALLAGLATTPLLARGSAGQSNVYSHPCAPTPSAFSPRRATCWTAR